MNIRNNLKRAESLPIMTEISQESDKKSNILHRWHIEDAINNIYGIDAIKFLRNKKINLDSFVSRYDPNKNDHIDFIAVVTSEIVKECEKSGGVWLHELYLQLIQAVYRATQLVPRDDANNHEKNILYLNKLKRQGIVLALEIAKVKNLKSLSRNENQKAVKSLAYAIAALQDPFNEVLAEKLKKNASQTIGAEDKLKQFYRAFVALAGLITAFLGMPFTSGASFPMAYVGGLTFFAGSADFFYHQEHGIAKEISGLSNVMKSMPRR